VRAEIAGGAPLVVACAGESAGGLLVRLAAGERSGGDTAVVEVFDDEPGPEYVLEKTEAQPVSVAAGSIEDVAAPTEPGASYVEGTDVFLAIDGRGRARGAVRFDLVTTDATLRLRLPQGMRLYDVLVDGTDVATVPRAADTWELRLHDMAWPRTVLAIFAGEVGGGFAEGRPISLPPPAVVGLPTGDVLWTVTPPPGFELRLSEPARTLGAAAQAAARRAVTLRQGERFERALLAIDARQEQRLREFFDLRRRAGVTAPEAAWQRAVGWPSADAVDPGTALAATSGGAELMLRAVRRPDVTTPGRALATCGLVLAAGVAWAVMAWKAGRRRQAKSDLAHGTDHR
jgi:hypothetical protein